MVGAPQQQPRGPTPQPAIGAACSSGYQRGGAAAAPGPNTRCRAFPKSGATCPTGYTTSCDDCVETGASRVKAGGGCALLAPKCDTISGAEPARKASYALPRRNEHP